MNPRPHRPFADAGAAAATRASTVGFVADPLGGITCSLGLNALTLIQNTKAGFNDYYARLRGKLPLLLSSALSIPEHKPAGHGKALEAIAADVSVTEVILSKAPAAARRCPAGRVDR